MIGLDKHIDFTVGLLNKELWQGFNNSFNGRSFRLNRNNKTIPEVYTGNGEFKEVLLSDKFDSIIHFDVEPEREKISPSLYKAKVNIIVSVNIGEIYGNSTRATESAIKDVYKVLKNSPFELNSVLEFPDALQQYDIDKREKIIFNMQPYYVFSIKTTIKYSLNEC